jgi:hypothetical protein
MENATVDAEGKPEYLTEVMTITDGYWVNLYHFASVINVGPRLI